MVYASLLIVDLLIIIVECINLRVTGDVMASLETLFMLIIGNIIGVLLVEFCKWRDGE